MDVKESGNITGSYDVSKSEQEHLRNAAMLSAKAQEAMTRYRLRQKTQITQVKPMTKAKTESATEGACPAHPAAKCRAARGTAGTCCGHRPPIDPEVAAEFAAINDA